MGNGYGIGTGSEIGEEETAVGVGHRAPAGFLERHGRPGDRALPGSLADDAEKTTRLRGFPHDRGDAHDQ